ncbi:MAG TPA: hypothetical protein VFW03_26185 [Gemmatimonadaceae bacterium]|nr:hypothetical protein [Gemmatimonadaceae bacterium]
MTRRIKPPLFVVRLTREDRSGEATDDEILPGGGRDSDDVSRVPPKPGALRDSLNPTRRRIAAERRRRPSRARA